MGEFLPVALYFFSLSLSLAFGLCGWQALTEPGPVPEATPAGRDAAVAFFLAASLGATALWGRWLYRRDRKGFLGAHGVILAVIPVTLYGLDRMSAPEASAIPPPRDHRTRVAFVGGSVVEAGLASLVAPRAAGHEFVDFPSESRSAEDFYWRLRRQVIPAGARHAYLFFHLTEDPLDPPPTGALMGSLTRLLFDTPPRPSLLGDRFPHLARRLVRPRRGRPRAAAAEPSVRWLLAAKSLTDEAEISLTLVLVGDGEGADALASRLGDSLEVLPWTGSVSRERIAAALAERFRVPRISRGFGAPE